MEQPINLDPIVNELKEINSTLKESTKSGERMNLVLFLVSITQVLLAFSQLLLSFAYSDSWAQKGLGIFMVVATLVILIVFGNRIFRNK